MRHPRGVTTLDIDPETQTIEDLQVLIFSATEIPPSEQESKLSYWALRLELNCHPHSVKYGYPPRSLPSTVETLSTIPITRGEQIIVTSVPSSSRPANPTPPPSVKAVNETFSAPSPLAAADIPAESSESVALPGRDAGFLQLRVVPDDNSCLFSAIAVVFEGGVEGGKGLRKGVSTHLVLEILLDQL